MTMTTRLVLGLLAVCFLGSGPCQANPVTFPVSYQADGASYTGLGAQYISAYDILNLLSNSDTIAGPGNYLLNDVYFEVGINSSTGHTDTGTLLEALTVGAALINLSIPYSLNVAASDTISILGTTVWTSGLKIVVNPLTLKAGDYYGTDTGKLTMDVSAVPIPSALPLFAGGLACLGLLGRRRRKQLQAV